MMIKQKAILGGIFYLSFLLLGHFTHGTIDAIQRIELTRSILFEGDVVTPEYGPINYSPLQSIVMIPPYLLGYSIGKLSGQPEEKRRNTAYRFCAFLFNPIICSLMAVLFFEFLRELKFDPSTSLLSTFMLVFGTLLFPYIRIMFSEPLNSLLILSSLFLFYKSLSKDFIKNNRLNLLLLGLLFLNNPVFIVYYFLMFGFVFWKAFKLDIPGLEKKKLVIDFLAILSSVAAIYCFYNYLRYGNPFSVGYAGIGFINPLFVGIYGLLFSIGRGLVFYSPLTIICIVFFILRVDKLESRLRYLFGFLLLSFFVYLMIYSKWQSWEGGWCWGPRFLLPFIPSLHLLFPFLLQSIKRGEANKLSGFLFLVIVAGAVSINGYEYLGIWQHYQGAEFGAGDTPYWYGVFNPHYSFLFNNWEWDMGWKRLTQFIFSVSLCYYLTMVWFKKRFFSEVR